MGLRVTPCQGSFHGCLRLLGLVTKSCLTFLWTPWTVAHQTSLSMGSSRQEYWSGLPFPFPLQEKEMLLRLEVAISFFFF